ncbi:sugar kinase [Kitasatospora herbaricolor]|uniref:1-phosphofructokinase family hexose kinase n=1 Tax=Kitasatospora herbaricolor TaxID=68217 RepID=UPI00174C2C08|nr:hexose kinase [Kitasatospora herbaricolor]MDQ0312615.1 tagatose 6-phosphate kinase [Kitasatospora herbaricolor]GGV38794.1 sugar kinase [Kitasatospora herbaricolor]
MIVTVTADPVLDVTYNVRGLRANPTHRVVAAHEQAGGKGVNVSRVLTTLGRRTTAVLPLAGPNGIAVQDDLQRAGVTHCLVPGGAPTRRSVAVVDDHDMTMFNEAAQTSDDGWWHALTGVVHGLLPGARALVVSGSLPAGLPPNSYRTLVVLAGQRGLPVILDADGPPLTGALDARPTLVKLKATQLLAATGTTDPLAAARALTDRGARNVVASVGPAGILAVTTDGTWRASLPGSLTMRGHPTGAGDAVVASLAASLSAAAPWPQALADAVALSAATVVAPYAGHFDRELHQALLPAVRVEAL